MQKRVTVIGIILIVLLVLTGWKCGKPGAPGEFTGGYYTDVTTRSPGGALITSRYEISPATGISADRAFNELFRIARQYNYTEAMSIPAYQVHLFDRSPMCITPAFLLRANGSPWDQTDYDKDRKPGKVLLCAAGMTLSPWSMLIVDDAATVETIVRYEGEHLILIHNDQDRWEATIGIHAHPILPDKQTDRIATIPPEWKAVGVGTMEAGKGLAASLSGVTCVVLTK